MKSAFTYLLLYSLMAALLMPKASAQSTRPDNESTPSGPTFKIASWSDWSGDDLYLSTKKGSKIEDNMVKVDIMNLRYSTDYSYKKNAPIIFYRKTGNEDDPYAKAYTITIPNTYSDTLILLNKVGQRINHLLYELDDSDFQFGSYKIVNFTTTPLLVKFGEKHFKVQSKKSASYNPSGPSKKAVGCKVAIQKDGKTNVVYSNMLMRRPHKRMIVFFYTTKDEVGRQTVKSRSLVDFKRKTPHG